MKKIFSLIGTLLIISLLLIPASAVFAAPCDDNEVSIKTISPNGGVPGTEVVLEGYIGCPNGQYEVYWGDCCEPANKVAEGYATCDPYAQPGSENTLYVEATFNVPDCAHFGENTVWLVDIDCACDEPDRASVPFFVNPIITILDQDGNETTNVDKGDTIKIHGDGWLRGDSVYLIWECENELEGEQCDECNECDVCVCEQILKEDIEPGDDGCFDVEVTVPDTDCCGCGCCVVIAKSQDCPLESASDYVWVGASIRIIQGAVPGTFFIEGNCFPGYNLCDITFTWEGQELYAIDMSRAGCIDVSRCEEDVPCDPGECTRRGFSQAIAIVPDWVGCDGDYEVGVHVEGTCCGRGDTRPVSVSETAIYTVDTGKYKGLQGDEGAQGLQGNEGAQGPQGDEGAQGPQGDEGTQGPQGLQGSQGSSAEANADVSQNEDAGEPTAMSENGSSSDKGMLIAIIIASLLGILCLGLGGIALSRIRSEA